MTSSAQALGLTISVNLDLSGCERFGIASVVLPCYVSLHIEMRAGPRFEIKVN